MLVAPLGLCRTSLSAGDDAWRRFEFQFVPATNEMLLQNYYKYRATRDLSVTLPR